MTGQNPVFPFKFRTFGREFLDEKTPPKNPGKSGKKSEKITKTSKVEAKFTIFRIFLQKNRDFLADFRPHRRAGQQIFRTFGQNFRFFKKSEKIGIFRQFCRDFLSFLQILNFSEKCKISKKKWKKCNFLLQKAPPR
jgi:hypothetical protein